MVRACFQELGLLSFQPRTPREVPAAFVRKPSPGLEVRITDQKGPAIQAQATTPSRRRRRPGVLVAFLCELTATQETLSSGFCEGCGDSERREQLPEPPFQCWPRLRELLQHLLGFSMTKCGHCVVLPLSKPRGGGCRCLPVSTELQEMREHKAGRRDPRPGSNVLRREGRPNSSLRSRNPASSLKGEPAVSCPETVR